MKVTYFHGLESQQGGAKVQFLKTIFDEVYAPKMDYRGNSCLFDQVLNASRESSLIIGSSMGGWFGYLVATHQGCPSLLFNPAVHSRSVRFDIEAGKLASSHRIVLGDHDVVINPLESRNWIAAHGVGDFTFQTYDGEHRVPVDVFKYSVRELYPKITRSLS